MPVFIDQAGRKIKLNKTPKRIISVVPSQTELLFDLGLNEEVIAITKFCVHPEEWFRNKPRVGGTKQLKIDLIHQLQPDLIIANKEENVKEQIEELEKYFPVWVSDVNNLNDAYQMIGQIGLITNKQQQAKQMTVQIKINFSRLLAPDSRLLTPDSRLPTIDSRLLTCYLIWQKPYMTAGGDTFIHAMMEAAGFENVFKNKTRYPEITIPQLQTANCQLLLLSSEPFPFKQKHIDELQPQLPGTKIILVDGEMFSWYGSRLLKAPEYFKKLIPSFSP
jgi:ABC-type Fe3+-hydroxamate transport system substrate-binding protein